MASQFASGKVPTLTRKLNASDSTAYLDSDVGVTSGRLYFSNNLQEEWISFSGVSASGSEYAYTGLVRGLSQTADPATAGSGKTWLASQKCSLVEMHDQTFNRQRPSPLTFATTAARDTALGADGAATEAWVNVYVTATSLHYNYNLGTNQWEAVDTGTVTPNASTTAAGKVEIATQTEVDTPTDVGWTGATVVVIPSTFQTGITNRISDQSTAETGEDNTKLMTPLRTKQSASKIFFGWNGSDGSVAAALTITGSNNSTIVKNYSSFAPWANTVTITPTGCVTVVRVSWNLDLTGTTLSFAGKWMPGWTPGAINDNGGDGSVQTGMYKSVIPAGGIKWNGSSGGGGGAGITGNGGIGGAWTGASSAKWEVSPLYAGFDFLNSINSIPRFVAQGGGASGSCLVNIAGSAGGAGGGTLIFEVAWNVTLSWTTANFNWIAWTVGWSSGGYYTGGGGGGGGGLFVILYAGTLSWSVTPNVSGWTGGNGGYSWRWTGGTAWTQWNDGGAGEGYNPGGGGGGGGGAYAIVKVTV